MDINIRQLKLCEKKVFVQVKYYFENNFGSFYDVDYYVGDFFMGLNLFCWQLICFVGVLDICYGLVNIRFKDNSDV